MTDALGEVTYAARYTPWGDTLDSYGTGNFAFGYFGGLMDAATGLLYVGDGQYYDPSTGRFLTRNAGPNSANPYLPFDPTGAMLGPLGVLALVLGRKKKKSKYDVLLFVLVFAVVLGMALSACGPGDGDDGNVPPPPSETPPPSPPTSPPPSPTPPSSPPTEPPPAPTNKPSLPDCPDPYYYDCTDSSSGVCIKPEDDAVFKMAHTVYGEGGAGSRKAGANIIQIALNRAYTAWEISHRAGINPNNIPWAQMTQKQLTSLLLFIFSEPGSPGSSIPAFNAWYEAYPHSGLYWQDTVDAITNLLADPGKHPTVATVKVKDTGPAAVIKSNINIIFYGASKDKDWKPPVDYLHVDAIPENNPCSWQYYGIWPINPPDEVISCEER